MELGYLPEDYQRRGTLEPVQVLDYGHIQLVDSMGHDMTPVDAARVSYASKELKAGGNNSLLEYLALNEHLGPFEFIEVVWSVKVPIMIARQWHRHRTASYNEFSMRYADPTRLADGEEMNYYIPELWRKQSKTNKQGSDGQFTELQAEYITDRYQNYVNDGIKLYHEYIDEGMANELARMVLHPSMYTHYWYKTNMRNLLHFLHLRMDPHAQWEMVQFADAIAGIVEIRWPQIWGLYQEGNFS